MNENLIFDKANCILNNIAYICYYILTQFNKLTPYSGYYLKSLSSQNKNCYFKMNANKLFSIQVDLMNHLHADIQSL